MTAGELYDICQMHLRRQDFNKSDFYRLLNQFLAEAFRKATFITLTNSVVITPTNPWCAPLPQDFYDDQSVTIIGAETMLSLPLQSILSSNDLYMLYGTNNISAIKQRMQPTIPYAYYIGVPSNVFTNFTADDIPENEASQKCLIFYPPIDRNRYRISLVYYPQKPTDISQDDDTHPLMEKYPEWVMYEMLWRVFAAFEKYDAVTLYKQLAHEKFLEVKANEAREIMTPITGLRLVTQRIVRRPLPWGKVSEIGRQIIRPERL